MISKEDNFWGFFRERERNIERAELGTKNKRQGIGGDGCAGGNRKTDRVRDRRKHQRNRERHRQRDRNRDKNREKKKNRKRKRQEQLDIKQGGERDTDKRRWEVTGNHRARQTLM